MSSCVLVSRFFVFVLLAAGLQACNTTGTGSSTSPVRAETPVSQQSATGEARQRAKVHTELGVLYFQDGRPAVAMEEAKVALEADSSYAPAYNLLGLVHMLLGELQPAEDNFQRALSYAVNDPEINNNYGWFLCQSGKELQAMRHFQLAYRNPLYRTPTMPYTYAGICSVRIKDFPTAETSLNSALRADPSNSLATFWLAEVFLRTNRLIEARGRINDLLRMVEPNAELIWLALRLERASGDREAELRYATQLRRKFQDSPEYQKLVKGQYE